MSEDVSQDAQNRPQERRGGADGSDGVVERVEWAVWYDGAQRPNRVMDEQEAVHWCGVHDRNWPNTPARLVRRTVTTTAWEDA